MEPGALRRGCERLQRRVDGAEWFHPDERERIVARVEAFWSEAGAAQHATA